MIQELCTELNEISADNLSCVLPALKDRSFLKMAAETTGLAKLDTFLANIFAKWDIYSTIIATIIVLFVTYSLLSSRDPDVHPYLLARQSTEAPVRQPGQSAAFRNLEVPHGFPLKHGLNVKDPEAPKWTGGRNGDLRDIWKLAISGSNGEIGTTPGQRGKLFSVLGKKAIERNLDDITAEINVIGRYVQESEAKVVAVSLSDSVELLASLFASAFYSFQVVLIPHNLDPKQLGSYLKKNQAELLIAEAGAVDLTVVTVGNKQLKNVIWIAKEGSRHMDWNEVPEKLAGSVKVAVWHELVQEKKTLKDTEVPGYDPKATTPSIFAFWPTTQEFIEYKPQNLVSGVGALLSSLPRNQRLDSNDVVLTIDSLMHPYALCWILAALYSNSSIALNSVAGEGVDFALATLGISPTVIVSSARTISDYHKKFMKPHTGLVSSISRLTQARALDAGRMPSQNILSRLANIGPTAELSLSKLRLLAVSYRVDGSPDDLLSSELLTDLRIFTGARIVYALTAPGIAGAIAQTHLFDYRRHEGPAHFGAPLSSVEIVLSGHIEDTGIERAVEGQLTVTGPAVVTNTITIPVRARFRDDNTLQLLK
ncbi:conserved hypothetical protein [Talaromyces stipitatus ATCC 10500]|uniref:AMP-dependent synthetase/ligase domain-containing protein n=1 Tax=Talaromyces stipitatus (strain ATCC 10500 / CBS 375.48 / QM 6759 / NRRL 1006) TaxID=441959 RepID=B8M9N5_TALSN|nr:uncharacterized protein TSTA_118090 [Talaromyces stipitatus ATCC 10500]EED18037.1 conserved hypothetical protein [Talaromyces stipitatus ATCC 10500]